MRTFKPNLRSSIYSILSLGHPSVPAATDFIGIEDIRSAMLELITAVEAARFPQLTRRISYAGDVQGLWFLRGDLMAALANSHGEAAAREKLETLSELFEDLLPGGLRSRPSPLSAVSRDFDAPDSALKPS
jgi:hypothetical protein